MDNRRHQIPRTGNRVIDADHVALARLIRLASEQMRDPDGEQRFAATVDAFRDLLARHFAMEAVIVSGSGYAATPQHLNRHTEILGEIDEMISVMRDQRDATLRFDMIDRMERVLFEHEILEDSRFWESVRAGAAPCEPRTPLVWTDDLAIGVEWVDQQHYVLIEMLNELYAGARDGADQPGFDDLLERFCRHSRQHFAEEERRLEQMGKPVSAHRQHHLALLAGLDRLVESCRTHPEALATDYLSFWLLDHIRGDDRVDFAPAA